MNPLERIDHLVDKGHIVEIDVRPFEPRYVVRVKHLNDRNNVQAGTGETLEEALGKVTPPQTLDG